MTKTFLDKWLTKVFAPIETKRLSVRSFGDNRDEYTGSGFMFVQDITTGILPFRFKNDGDGEFEINVTADKENKAKLAAALAPASQYNRPNLHEIINDAIDEIAKSLAWSGRATYEILRDPKTSKLVLVWFTPRRLVSLRWVYVQITPEKKHKRFWSRIIVVPRSRIWKAQIPKALGGYRGHRKMLRKLGRFSFVGPRFHQRALGAGQPWKDYDVQEYHRERAIYESRATGQWGWNRRDLSQNYCTEFMTFDRTLRFKQSQAILREHIVSELNKLLPLIGVNGEITLSGVPTPKHLSRLRAEMTEGKITLLKAFEAASPLG